MSDTEAYKVKCRNCIACEQDEGGYYCDRLSTQIGDADRAFCSYFMPYIKEDDEC